MSATKNKQTNSDFPIPIYLPDEPYTSILVLCGKIAEALIVGTAIVTVVIVCAMQYFGVI